MKWPWGKDGKAEENRKLRGELADRIIQLDRERITLDKRVRESPIQDIIVQLVAQIDEGRRG